MARGTVFASASAAAFGVHNCRAVPQV